MTDTLIYISKFDLPIQDTYFQFLLDNVPNEIKSKTLKFRRWEDAHAFLLGKHLLILAMSRLNKPLSLKEIQYTSYGRPYLQDGLDFNISHSGNVVVCAVSLNGKIGIDIEKKENIDIHGFSDKFSFTEWNNILVNFPELDKFYEYWTKKEAVLKADGRGINELFSSLEVANKNNILLDKQVWHLSNIDVFYNYSCHIACNIQSRGYILEHINFHDNHFNLQYLLN